MAGITNEEITEHEEDNESTSAEKGLVCSLHSREKSSSEESITLFNAKSLEKCKLILKARKEQNLKYATFQLPENIDNDHGYHMDCYRRFIALSKAQRLKMDSTEMESNREELSLAATTTNCLEECDATISRTTRSALTILQPNSRTGVFPSICIFCEQSRKKVKGVEQKLVSAQTKAFEESIRKYIEWMQDSRLSTRLTGIDFSVKEIKYHATCRIKYQTEAEYRHKQQEKIPSNSAEPSRWHVQREAHKKAFESLCCYINKVIIEDKEIVHSVDINTYYSHLLYEFKGEEFQEAVSRTQKLEEKINSRYGESIQIVRGSTKQGNIIFSNALTLEEALAQQRNRSKPIDVKIQEVALALRREIQDAEKISLPEALRGEDIENGEIDVPEKLLAFFQTLISGPDYRCRRGKSKILRAKSISQDAIFAATSGNKKPNKLLMLGIAVKSLTGSRKVVEILNKLGHCVSYHTVEELETELTFEATKSQRYTPNGMILSKNLGTGLAWDNFDRFVDTGSGKDTLHDTVGIAYQLVQDEDKAPDDIVKTTSTAAESATRKRRRTYEPRGLSVEPYRKKPRFISSSFLENDNPKRKEIEDDKECIAESWKMDILWMKSFLVDEDLSTPVWAGWNSLFSRNLGYTHKIWYMPQINQSPTNYSVVAETMRRSMKVAEEAGRSTIAVTYDLAIAKIAYQIKREESPKYDSVFVALGAFHIEMAFFHAMGKIIADSGGPHILQESEALAKGSINGFLSGKNYKRCKRLHEILSLAFELLHFERFLKLQEDREEILAVLKLDNNPRDSRSFEIDAILKRYHRFCYETDNGTYGKTSQFWMKYINLFHLYHDFSRSVREGDLQLYISTLPRITNIFFALNHINYSRWLVKYYDSLLKLSTTHFEVYEDFKRGLFGIKRTKKTFSSTPIDLTLEQTINADAASQRLGITSVTNSISARQRWAESHFIRTAIISSLFDQLYMRKSEEVSHHLRASKVQKDNVVIRNVVDMIKDTMNPFGEVEHDHLYNIATGKAASTETENFLLNINSIGEIERKRFIDECIERKERFEERIVRQKVKTFATECGRKKISSKDGKMMAACLMRDLFGSLLYLSLEKRIDISEVLKYPLTPVPLSLCHVDGTILKSPKSALLKYLESQIVSHPPREVNVTIIDAMFFLHLLPILPSSFDGVARYLLGRIVDSAGSEIHFVADKWITPSIKDLERTKRASCSDAIYSIKGPNQKRPGNWIAALRSNTFKESLIHFLTEQWKDNSYAEILGEKILYANFNDQCFRYHSDGINMVWEEVEMLYCTHEEADSRMFFHLSTVQQSSNIVVRTADTDCLVIALGCKHLFNPGIKVWLEVGLQNNNTQRFIDVNKLYTKLGFDLCKSLPAYHALTGCDYTSSFSRKGKVKPLKILQKNETMQKALASIAFSDSVEEEVLSVIEKYVCLIYGKKNLGEVNDARTHIFLEKYRPKNENDRLTCVRRLDGSMLPPCHKVLMLKVKRTQYVARQWVSSVSAHPPHELPEEYGWKKDDTYKIAWFDGDAMPQTLDVVCGNDDLDHLSDEEDHANCLSSDDDEIDDESDDD